MGVLIVLRNFVLTVVFLGIVALVLLFASNANNEIRIADSQANLNNSAAGYNYAQATAVIVDAQGGYILNSARATQIVSDSNWGPINTYQAGQQQGMGFGLIFMIVIFAFVGVFLMYAMRGRS
jgi:hypothetical protein